LARRSSSRPNAFSVQEGAAGQTLLGYAVVLAITLSIIALVRLPAA
jgi:hypothetical protein